MSALPSGVVTLLFSDIEGSTALLQQLGDAEYGTLLRRHRESIRAVLARHAGHEVGTEGDSFFVAFVNASDAVAAAVAAQLAIEGDRGLDGVRVRMGLHTGETTVDGSEYYGLTVHEAARIGAAAHGGQVLLSGVTAALVEGRLPAGASLSDLGSHRLRSLLRPQHLWQLCHPDLESDFPPVTSGVGVVNNLPAPTSTFVGRHRDLVEVQKQLEQARLVSIVGPGGAGKTRLACELAARHLGNYPDGVWFVELAKCAEESEVVPVTVAALGLRDVSASPADDIVRFLDARQALLVLDNCEHVVDAAARLAEDLLLHLPALRVLTTTREPLRVPGEACCHLAGLALAGGRGGSDERDQLQADAERLFVERAQDANAGFASTADPDLVGLICARLDGLPLAIELAAARARSMSLQEIYDRLGNTLDLLSKGARTAAARHSTLKATITWSYNLLSEEERSLFTSLAVFQGGWTLDAATAVLDREGTGPTPVFQTLDRLVDRSLVALDADTVGVRYRLLETVRAFALGELEESGRLLSIREAHAKWCRDLATRPHGLVEGSLAEAEWFSTLETEQPNILAAFDHLQARGMRSRRRWRTPGYLKLIELAAAMCDVWRRRGHWALARDRIRNVLAAEVYSHSGRPREYRARAKLLVTLATMASRAGDQGEAADCLKEALAVANLLGVLGDRRGEADCRGALGEVRVVRREFGVARDLFAEAREMSVEHGDRRGEGVWLGSMWAATEDGDREAERLGYEQALAIAIEVGDSVSEQRWLRALCGLARVDYEPSRAMALAERAVEVAQAVGDRRGEAATLGLLADIALENGDRERCRRRHEERLAILVELGDRHASALCELDAGVASRRVGAVEDSRTHFLQALDAFAELGDRKGEAVAAGHLAGLSADEWDGAAWEAWARREVRAYQAANSPSSALAADQALQHARRLRQLQEEDRRGGPS